MSSTVTASLRILFLGLMVSAAAAAPDSARTYRDAMSEGRSLEDHSNHAGAVQAFERALAANPGDASALSELGSALLHAGQLERAARATEDAIARAKDPKLKAASLYNRGLIEERRGEKNKAADSFRQSLSLRPNAIVSARLAALRSATSAAPTSAGPFAPRPLDGPYPSLDAWCSAVRQIPSPPEQCFLNENTQAKLAQPSGPWQAAQTLLSGSFDARQLRVAASTPAGWFVSRPAEEPTFLIAPREVMLRENAGGASWLVVRYVQVVALTDRPESARWTQECSEMLMLCGLAASNRPSCTSPIPVRAGSCTDPNKQIDWTWEVDVQFLGEGRIQVKPKNGVIPTPAKDLLGTHALSFR